MSTIVNISTILMKRGNTTAGSNYVGPLGELLVDTGLKTIRVQDGSTAGGMSTLVTTQELSNVVAAIEGIQGNITANVEALLANINVSGITQIAANVANLQANSNSLNSGVYSVVLDTNGNLIFPGSPDGTNFGNIEFSVQPRGDYASIAYINTTLPPNSPRPHTDLAITPNGEFYLNLKNPITTRGGFSINLNAGSATSLNSTPQPGGSLSLNSGSGAWGGTDGGIYLSTPNYTWAFGPDGTFTASGKISTTDTILTPSLTGIDNYINIGSSNGNVSLAGNVIASGNLTIHDRGDTMLFTTGNNRAIHLEPQNRLYMVAGQYPLDSSHGGHHVVIGASDGYSIDGSPQTGGDLYLTAGGGANGGQGGSVSINTGDVGSINWNFGFDGNLTLPSGPILMPGYPTVGYAADVATLAGAQVYLSSTDGIAWLGIENGTPSIGNGPTASWAFGPTGVTTLPYNNYIETINTNMAIGSQGAVTIRTNAATNTGLNSWIFGADGTTLMPGNVTIAGNLIVNGNTTTISASNLIINDNIVYFAAGNPANTLDIGIAGHFNNGTYQHTGLIRQASSGQWKLFSNVTAEPTNTIDFTYAVYDPIQVGAITSPTIVDLYANAAIQSANIATLQSNVASQATDITTLYANAASQATSLNTINANVGSFYIWANTNFGTSSYSNTNVAAYISTYSGTISSNSISSTGTIIANRFQTTAATPNGGSYVTDYVGSLLLSPNSSIVNTGIVIGGNGYLLGPNGSRNAQLNYGSVGGQFGIYQLNVYGGQATAIVNGGTSNVGNIGSTTGWFGNAFINSVIANNYLFGNGVNILSTVAGGSSTYSNTNVAAYLTSQNITSANIGTLFIGNATTQANLGAYQTWANATFTSSSNTYGNANVVSMLSANSIVVVGNTNPYPTPANITQLFVGNGAAITSGGAASPGAMYIAQNVYFGVNAAPTYRNTQTGAMYVQIQNGTMNWVGTSGAVTANTSASGMGTWMQLSSTGLATQNSLGITSAGPVAVNSATGITTTATTFSLLNAIATTMYFAGAATALTIGASTVNVQVGGSTMTGNISAGNVSATNYLFANGVNILSTVTGGSGTYSNTNVAAYLTSNTVTTINTVGNITTVANIIAPNYLFANGVNILSTTTSSTALQTLNANVGAYESWANANLATQTTNINTINANVGTLYLGNITTQANIGAYQTWANATFATTGGPSTATLSANLGAYQTWANATFATTSGPSTATLSANIGAYEIWANANLGTQQTSINSINANLGAYQTYANTTFSGGGGGATTRTVISAVTGNISANANANVTLTGFKGYALYSISANVPAWVTVYSSVAARSSDYARPITTDPSPGSGVLAEAITVGNSTQYFTPAVIGFSAEAVPDTNIQLKIGNTGTYGNIINVSLTLLKLES